MSTPVGEQLREWFAAGLVERARDAAGGPARLRVVLLLAGVLALSTADAATVGALAGQLEHALGLTNTQVGLLVTGSVGVGALATLPFGALADRVDRVRLLRVSVLVWAVAMLVSALATSFTMLLVTRLALGVVVASAYPATASLTGDLFAPAERGRVYGWILTGELLGTGIGFVVSGGLAAVLSWRAGFAWLAVPSLLLAWALGRWLPEPARGGASRLEEGDEEVLAADEAEQQAGGPAAGGAQGAVDGEAERIVRTRGIRPRDRLVLDGDPSRRSLWWAVRYTLSIRTNLLLVIASGLGYFFLQGLETFAVVYASGRYGLGPSTASTLLVGLGLGAVVGVLVTGWASDRLLHSGRISARPVVAGAAFLAAAALFVPALLAGSLPVAAPLLFLAAAALGGTNPPLNAARLDLVPSALWGRAEGVRTALSTLLQALAPLLVGVLSTAFGGSGGGLGEPSATAGDAGLEQTFLVMLAALAVAGLLLVVRARASYPRDVASAIASERAAARRPVRSR
jgi:predicted MFS family arabinose efflux permease